MLFSLPLRKAERFSFHSYIGQPGRVFAHSRGRDK
jgi:hypothetical protein